MRPEKRRGSVTALTPKLKRVYWETTAGCNLRCTHCRRVDVLDQASPEELTTSQAKTLIGELQAMGRPVLIFSGGEPLARKDLFELAAYAHALGLPIALSTNGTLVDAPTARRLKEAGIYYASVSFDGAKARTHDFFRGAGNYERALAGFGSLRDAQIKVQINFTVTRLNVPEVQEIYEMARSQRAIALYLFLLVPVGCGEQIAADQMLGAAEVERWLEWVAEKDREGPLPIKAICAPQFYRVAEPETGRSSAERRGCLAGVHMCFISHKGDVFPCGYLPSSSGNIRREPLQKIWNNSPLFESLRSPDLLTGRCGACEYRVICGGCRARGYYAHGDVLAEEPYCAYEPAVRP